MRRLVLALALLLSLVAVPAAAAARTAPNLQVSKVTTSAKQVQAFGSFVIKDTVVRSGRVPSGLHVEYVLSSNTRRDRADVPLLGVRAVPKGPGKNAAITRLTSFGLTPPGRYFVLACADPGDRLREAREQDNCAATSTRIRVIAAPAGRTHNVTTRLASGRTEELELFLHDVGRFGTEAGTVATTAADGTRYTLSVPADAALMSLPITITPVTSVSGLPGSPRVMGVKITPEVDLTRAATLTVQPAKVLREDRALPAAYDGNGSTLRLTPMTSRPGKFTFHVTHLGGFLLVEGQSATSGVTARMTAGMTLKDLFSWSPTAASGAAARDTQVAIGFERQRQLRGSAEGDGSAVAAIAAAAVQPLLAAARAEIAATGANPTIGRWDGLLRSLIGVQRQLSLTGMGNAAGDQAFATLLPLLRPVYAKVISGVHACDDGMGDVLATAVLRAGNDLTAAMFDLAPDTDTACTKLRAHVSYVESRFVDDEFQTTTQYSAGITWRPKDVLDYTDQSEDATYSTYSFHDVCEHGEGPLTVETPWVLNGVNVNWDALFQRWTDKPWEDPQRTPFRLTAHLGGDSQPGVLDDPGCDQAGGASYGPDWSPAMPLTYADGVLSGERIEDDTEGGSTHIEIRYDVTAVS